MRERLEHLQGWYRLDADAESTPKHRRDLEGLMGCDIPNAPWAVIADLGAVSLQHCFVEMDEALDPRHLEAFKTAEDICRMLAHRERPELSPPRSLLPLAVGNGGWFCVVLQGPLREHVVFWSPGTGRGRSTIPDWLEKAERDHEETSWRDVWRVAASPSAFLGQIRFRPTPSFESARIRSIAHSVLLGDACELTALDGRPTARLKGSNRWGSAATQISILSDEEAQQLGAFLEWHLQYRTRKGDEAPLPEFVGPKGLRPLAQQPAGRQRPSQDEALAGIAEAIRASEAWPLSLDVFVGQTYEDADLSLSFQGAPSPKLPLLRLFEGPLGSLRATQESDPSDDDVMDETRAFDDAVAAVAHLLSGPALASVLRECRARNRAFRCTVYGPYDEEPVVVRP